MDKKRSLLNVSTSIISHILLLIAALVVRRFLIQRIGNDVNGLNSLYTSILGVLAVAELGIGRAIIYSMYRPIINDDRKLVAALYGLYKKMYRIIGIVIFAAGLLITPFLPVLISDYESIDVNVYTTFILMLVSVVLSYFYSAKTALIEAHKDNYITTGIATVCSLIRYVLQMVVILLWPSFTIYLFCNIISTLLVWIVTGLVTGKKYGDIIAAHETVDDGTKAEIIRNVKAMFLHKVGTVMVNSADSMIISAFIGVVILGKYSNYNYIATSMVGIITLFFTPLTSVIGHLCAAGDKNETKKYFDFFFSINYILGVVFFLGYFSVIDYVVVLLFGTGLEVSRAIAFIITLSRFISYMRNAALLFRNASGTFYNDRWKPAAEGIVNVVLSITFVKVFPEDLRVVGVIVATIITTLLICDTVEPYVIYKHVFGKPVKKFYIRNYSYICFFIISLMVLTRLRYDSSSPVTGILVNGAVSIILSAITLLIVAAIDKTFRNNVVAIAKKAASNSFNLRLPHY